MDNDFLILFKNNLSISETLYERIEKIRKSKNMTKYDFYLETELDRSIINNIKNNSKPELRTVIAICIGLKLDPRTSFELIQLAGHHLRSTVYYEYAYLDLLQNYNKKSIAECNKRLKELEVEKKYYLGSQQRK